MDKIKYRDILYLATTILWIWIYIPHLIAYLCSNDKQLIDEDLQVLLRRVRIHLGKKIGLFFLLHNDKYFRSLFYFRINNLIAFLISWYRPGCSSFLISKTTKIAGGVVLAHPFATILNAESIGKNFAFRNLTTVGSKGGNDNRPIILDNVSLGASVSIIGKVIVGNNVQIGVGAVITKDVPDNCIVVGNPARIIYRDGLRVDEKL